MQSEEQTKLLNVEEEIKHGKATGGPPQRIRLAILLATVVVVGLVVLGFFEQSSGGVGPDGRPTVVDTHRIVEMLSYPEGAFSGDAVPFYNIDLATRGYNMFYADPNPPMGEGQKSKWPLPGLHLKKYTCKSNAHHLGPQPNPIVCGYKVRRHQACPSMYYRFRRSDHACSCCKEDPTAVGYGYSQSNDNELWVAPWMNEDEMRQKSNMDPGLRKPVWKLEYTKGGMTADRRHTQPDGFFATVDKGCSTVSSSTSIKDEFDYTRETAREISITAGVEISAGISVSFPMGGDEEEGGGDDSGGDDDEGGNSVVGAITGVAGDLKSTTLGASAGISAGMSGTLSHTNSQIRTQGELNDRRMEVTKAKCTSYVVALAYGDLPQTHPAFQNAVSSLGDDASKHFKLFDDYGTHFFTTVKMGARYTVSSIFKNYDYNLLTKEVDGFGVSVGASASVAADVGIQTDTMARGIGVDTGVEASLDLHTPKEKKSAKAFKNAMESQRKSAMGPDPTVNGLAFWKDIIDISPVPIRHETREICLHPAFDTEDMRTHCSTHLNAYCEGALQERGAVCKGEDRECGNDAECPKGKSCLEFKCYERPVCTVTMCDGPLHDCGETRTLPSTTLEENPSGLIVDHNFLSNGGWFDRVSSIKLSDGCFVVEAVDDDGLCEFGSADNRFFIRDSDLPYDLDNDVCMFRIFAWPAGIEKKFRRLSTSNVTHADGQETPSLAGAHAMPDGLWLRWTKEQKAMMLDMEKESELRDEQRPADRWKENAQHVAGSIQAEEERDATDKDGPAVAADALDETVVQWLKSEVALAQSTLKEAALRGAAEVAPMGLNDSAHERRLAMYNQGSEYVKNIGKAMYGYNHFFGAPLSSEFAGTDPGFLHRALWEVSYIGAKQATFETFTKIPRSIGADAIDLFKQEASNCECGGVLESFPTDKASVEKCGIECMQHDDCRSFGLYAGDREGECALYNVKCPPGNGLAAGSWCKKATKPTEPNTIYNMADGKPAPVAGPFMHMADNCECGKKLAIKDGMETWQQCESECKKMGSTGNPENDFKAISYLDVCEVNDEGLIPTLTYPAGVTSLNLCFALCFALTGCEGVDYLPHTKGCKLYEEMCKKPKGRSGGKAGSSYQRQVCKSYAFHTPASLWSGKCLMYNQTCPVSVDGHEEDTKCPIPIPSKLFSYVFNRINSLPDDWDFVPPPVVTVTTTKPPRGYLGCPAKCSTCKADTLSKWGLVLVDGKCTDWCSKYNRCSSLERGGSTDCLGCAADAEIDPNAPEQCLELCDGKSGVCPHCGENKACCKKGHVADAIECRTADKWPEDKYNYHSCVEIKPKFKYADEYEFCPEGFDHVLTKADCLEAVGVLDQAKDGVNYKNSKWGAGAAIGCFRNMGNTFVHMNLDNLNPLSKVALGIRKQYVCQKSTKPKYEWAAKNGLCPPRYINVNNAGACRAIGVQLGGKDLVSYRQMKWGSGGPVGCFRNMGNNCVHFNEQNLNAGTKVAAGANKQYLCQSIGSLGYREADVESPEPEPWAPVAKNCNCGPRLGATFEKPSEELCGNWCLSKDECKAFAVNVKNQCVLYKKTCPVGADGHANPSSCQGNGRAAPGPAWGNTVWNKALQAGNARRLTDASSGRGKAGGHRGPHRGRLPHLKPDAPAELVAGPERRLVQSGSLKVPKGWKVTMGKSTYCQKHFNSQDIRSNYDYTNELHKDFELGGIDVGYASFDYSMEFRDFRQANSNMRKMMVQTKAECIDYIAELEDLENNPPPTSKSFKHVIASTRTDLEYYALFDMYGLHFPTKVVFGSRYGYTRYISETNYKKIIETLDTDTVTAAVSYAVGVEHGNMGLEACASLEVSTTEKFKSEMQESVKETFESVREFSVGAKIPKSGVNAWIDAVSGEPMPTRFELTPICNHPAFAAVGKRETCFEAHSSYCKEYLSMLDASIKCDPSPQVDCVFDLDCGEHHLCVDGGCIPAPACIVVAYEDEDCRGKSMTIGPIYHSTHPIGATKKLHSMGDEISSMRISAGCKEVIVVDEDDCIQSSSDNQVVDMTGMRTEYCMNELKYDVDDDACELILQAKENWQ